MIVASNAPAAASSESLKDELSGEFARLPDINGSAIRLYAQEALLAPIRRRRMRRHKYTLIRQSAEASQQLKALAAILGELAEAA
jgi:hypothetical protein